MAVPGHATVVVRETRRAWLEYLAETRFLDAARYTEVEPWAWTRLQRRLDEIEARP